jgi:hypothetical protein
MPIPKPEENEDKQKFVSRCMSDSIMKEEHPDTKQRAAICMGESKQKYKASLIEEVHDNILISQADYDDDWDEWTHIYDPGDILDEFGQVIAEEKGKKVNLNKPFRTPGGPKKFSVYVKNDKGNVVKVNFGDPNMTIKRDDPERRKSYRARHNCDSPGPKWKANYWSCKMWSRTNVSDLT